MIRQTRQREAISQALKAAQRPLTPQELHGLAVETLPSLGLRTVYRQIRELVAAGEIVGIDYPGQPLRYEAVTGEHRAHYICRDCDRIFSFPQNVPDVDIAPLSNFEVSGQETIFYGRGRGLCSKCGLDE
jgi:Fur family ferric uptake transcriptional regulator|tara:strand:- start:2652 stop:3041 length:390 start_codon:yes stop_codon:yes gene_type:complete